MQLRISKQLPSMPLFIFPLAKEAKFVVDLLQTKAAGVSKIKRHIVHQKVIAEGEVMASCVLKWDNGIC